MKNLKLFFSLLMLIAASVVLSSSISFTDINRIDNESFNMKKNAESIVIGQIRNGNPVIARKAALQKALNNHYKGQTKVTELKISVIDKEAFLIATAKEKGGSTIEIAFPLEKKDLNLEAISAASETCSGCSHCAFAIGGGCECLAETGECSHSTTRDSLLDILETQNF